MTSFTEDWAGSNGAAWPAKWTISYLGTPGTTDIQSNAGRMVSGADGGNASNTFATCDTGTVADCEVTVDLMLGSDNSALRGYAFVLFRATDRSNAYMAWAEQSGGTQLVVSLGKNIGGTWSAIGTPYTLPSYTIGTVVHLKCGVVGTELHAKAWQGAASEPGSWQTTATATDRATGTKLLLQLQGPANAVSATFTWDNLTFTDLDAAPDYTVAPVITWGAIKNGTSGSNQTPTAPAGTALTGDLRIVCAAYDSVTAVATPSGWTLIDGGANTAQLRIWGRICTADAEAWPSFVGIAQDYVMVAGYVPVNYHGVADVATDIPHGTAATATSTAANPPSVTIDAAKNHTVVATCVIDMTATTNTLTVVPSGYTQVCITKSASSTSSVALGVATLAHAAGPTTEDPGAFTNTSRVWRAQTFAIPAGVAPTPPSTASTMIRVGGAWVTAKGIMARVAGAWVAASVYARIAGAWVLISSASVFEDAWTGSNGAAWDTGKWTTSFAGGAGTIDIQGNQGRMVTSAAGSYLGVARAIAVATIPADFEMYLEHIVGVYGEQYSAVYVRTDNNWNAGNALNEAPSNGYGFVPEIVASGTALDFNLNKVVANTITPLVGPISISGYSQGATIKMRIRCVGTLIQGKCWIGASEPGSWTISTTDSSHASGKVQLRITQGGAATAVTAFWDNLMVTAL